MNTILNNKNLLKMPRKNKRGPPLAPLPDHIQGMELQPQDQDTCPDMSFIGEKVWLGAQGPAENPDRLKAQGIEQVITLRESGAGISESARCPGIEYHYFEIRDDANADIKAIFRRASELLSNGKTTFVHCQKGVSRSATVVIAHFMMKWKMPLDDVYKKVQQQRSVVSPNLGFIFVLEELEKELK